MEIWVYRYRSWDSDREENVVSRDYFTLEAIRSGLGVPMIESGMKVRYADLDDSGRFHAYTQPASKAQES